MNRKLKNNIKAIANMVPMVIAVVIVFALLFVGVFVNGEIRQALVDTYPDNNASGTADWRDALQNTSVNRLDNTSENQDSALDIVQVVVIITVLAGAIAAIFLFTRFR